MRWLSRLMMAALLLLALVWGTFHLIIVPRIAELRPWVESSASRALGVPVRIGDMLTLRGRFVPSFELLDVRLLDPSGQAALVLPRVRVSLSLASLARLGFEQLYIERPTLTVQRLADGRIWVAGLEFSGGAAGAETRAADWFFSQREFVVQGGTVRWVDALREAGPLALQLSLIHI